MTPIAISTTSILARITREGDIGAVATRSAASSPEIVSQARPPASWPAAITMTGVISTMASGAVGKTAPQHQRRRHQIEQLHQGLRHQPGIAPQQHEFLPPQRLLPRAARGTPLARGAAMAGAALAEARDRGVGKSRREDRHHGAEQHEAAGQQQQQRLAVAERGARRPPDDAVGIGREAPRRHPRSAPRTATACRRTGSRRSAAR